MMSELPRLRTDELPRIVDCIRRNEPFMLVDCGIERWPVSCCISTKDRTNRKTASADTILAALADRYGPKTRKILSGLLFHVSP